MRNTKDMGDAVRPKPPDVQIAVQNFGPVAKADIELRPLTVFVGESNTGKTYLAALIYALHRTFHLPLKNGDMAGARSNFGNPEAFEDELKRCFNIDSVSELIRFTAKSRCEEMKVTLEGSEAGQTCYAFRLRAAKLGIAVESSINLPPQWELKVAASLDERSRAYFLPAGRRGLLQAHETGAATVKANGFSTDFLQQLVGNHDTDNGRSDKLHGIANLLETEVLRGKIEVKHAVAEGYPEFLYRPDETARALRMSQSSSMVSELAPLVLFLRGIVRPGDLLIIEEPEAHLHPGAQAAVALTLARLVRVGVRVIVTTHSYWFLQQIGNIIRQGEVYRHKDSAPTSASGLLKEEVGTWWFHRDKPVEEIPFDRIDGIEPRDFGDVSETLYNRSVDLQEQLAEITGERREIE